MYSECINRHREWKVLRNTKLEHSHIMTTEQQGRLYYRIVTQIFEKIIREI